MTILISNLTDKVFSPICSNNSLFTSPVGINNDGVGVDAISRGIGGRVLIAAGDCDRGISSGRPVDVVAASSIVALLC